MRAVRGEVGRKRARVGAARRWAAAVLAVAVGGAGLASQVWDAPPAAAATVLTVNALVDQPDVNLTDAVCEAHVGQGDCTLRAAVQVANRTAGAVEIKLGSGQRYALTLTGQDSTAAGGDLDLTNPTGITVTGNGSIVDAAASGDRAFDVIGVATITRVSVVGGTVTTSGGGIVVSGRLTLQQSALLNNSAASLGGGLYFTAASAANQVVVNTLFWHNTALKGGGVASGSAANIADLSWSTFQANKATWSSPGGNSISGKFTLTGNALDDDDPANVTPNACIGATTSNGFNMAVETTSCHLTAPTDIAADPLLGGLGAVVATSNVIDRGGSGCPLLDGAGFSHRRGAACDIGAAESLTPLVVNSTQDLADAANDGVCATSTGTCSLRAAIQTANELAGPDTIELAAPDALYALTRPVSSPDSGSSGDLDITDTTGTTTINGRYAVLSVTGVPDRVIEIATGAKAVIRDVTVEGGTAAAGGGILVSGGLDLVNGTITGNTSTGYGGGVFYTSGAIADPAVSRVTNSTFALNTALKGGGLAANISVGVTGSSFVSNRATQAGFGHDLLSSNSSTMTVRRTLVTNALTGGCAGGFVSTGSNVVTDPNCPRSRATDQVTSVDQARKKHQINLAAAADPHPSTPPTTSNYEATMAQAYASYLTNDPTRWTKAAEDINWLATNNYPIAVDSGGVLLGEFATPLLMRLALDPIARARMGAGSPTEKHVLEMIELYVRHSDEGASCRFGVEWSKKVTPTPPPDPWNDKGTENHALVRRTNCVLALYLLRDDDDIKKPGEAWGTYQQWVTMMAQFLEQRARTGLLDEVQSPNYGSISIGAILGLTDFAGDARLAALATKFVQLYWHDVAQSYNAKTGTVGASGLRTYQWNPDGAEGKVKQQGQDYGHAATSFLFGWSYLYGWHDTPPPPGISNVLQAAGNPFQPLAVSKTMANATTKNYEYVSMRPGYEGETSGGMDKPGHVRSVTANDDYVMGAMTVDPAKEGLTTENIWNSVQINGRNDDRIMVSGIAGPKPPLGDPTPSWADYAAVNGAEKNDAMIVGRDRKAGFTPTDTTNCPPAYFLTIAALLESPCSGNSRGIRIFLGQGELRRNLVIPANPGGWHYTFAGNAYVAFRLGTANVTYRSASGAVLTSPSAPDVSQITIDAAVAGAGDIWTPVVVQMGRASTYASSGGFAAFKTAVANRPYSYNATTKAVSYSSLPGPGRPAGDVLAMTSQQTTASLPTINGTGVNVAPAKTYDSPYLSMNWPVTPAVPTATLSAPGGAPPVTLALTY